MVTPDRRRVAVERLCERFGVSERRACAVVGQHRSTQRWPKAAPSRAEAELREHLRDFARCHPRLGWRKAHAVAHREGLVTNPKRTQRIWRDERLQRPPQRKAKRRRLTDGTAARLRAQRPNDVWALDFQFDETADLRRIKLLNVLDEFTREALCVEAAHSIDADGVVAAIERLVAQNSSPPRCATGAASGAPTPPTSSPARPGRTPTSSPSTDACETTASTPRTSPTSSKPESCSRTGALNTTPTGHTN